jgi:cytochrome c2
MQIRTLWASFVIAAAAANGVHAGDNDVAEGKKRYDKDCLVCHGDNTQASRSRPFLALQPGKSPWLAPSSRSDVPDGDLAAVLAGHDQPTRLAIAPPYGPSLRGVVGREAGSVKGFKYSRAFREAFKGMEWTEAALDVWLTDSSRWVPDSLMLYKQPDPEVRRQLIEFLKAHPGSTAQ